MKPYPTSFHVMVKPRGAVCNLGCEYCFYYNKANLYPDSNSRMSDEVLDSFTRQYIQTQGVPDIFFAWQGGEPTLMGLEFFQKAVDFQKKYRRPGMRIQNSFQTNGMLLDDKWCEFFQKNKFLVGLSMDGPVEVHDAFRKDHNNNPTHDKVLRASQLLSKHHVDFNILCCLHAASVGKGLEIYRYFRDVVQAQFIQFIPIVEIKSTNIDGRKQQFTSRTIQANQFGKFMIDVFDEWVQYDVGKVFIQTFDSALAAWTGQQPGLCIFEPTCGKAMALEHNGDLYACDHFVDPEYFLGNILETPLIDLVSSQKQIRFGNQKLDTLPDICIKCDVRFICNGECPKNRISMPSAIKGNKQQFGKISCLCEGYKEFFHHIDQPMKLMAALYQQGRSPAIIMDILKETQTAKIKEIPASQGKRYRHKKSG